MTEHEMLHKIYEWLDDTDRNEMIHPASAGELEMLLDDLHRELGYRDAVRYCTSTGEGHSSPPTHHSCSHLIEDHVPCLAPGSHFCRVCQLWYCDGHFDKNFGLCGLDRDVRAVEMQGESGEKE